MKNEQLKSRDLRIGNMVYLLDKKTPYRLQPADINTIAIGLKVFGVPLSKSLLVKMGGKCDMAADVELDIDGYFSIGQLSLRQDCKTSLFFYVISWEYDVPKDIVHLPNVHHLQNIYHSLFCEDLVI